MPPLGTISTAQIEATSGRQPRLSLAEALRLQTPQLYSDREAELSRGALAVQREAQETAQTQQTVGNVIGGAGTAVQAGLAAKALGVFGTPAATTAATTAGATSAGTAGAIGDVAGIGAAELAGTGATGGAAATGGISGALAAAAPYAGVAGPGLLAGFGASQLPIPRAGRAGVGAATGAATGALAGSLIFPGVGTLLGGALGAAGGALTAGICVIVSATHGRESNEVKLARRFRDEYMTRDQLKGYYAYAESVVPNMEQNAAYKAHIRTTLVEPLLHYGRYVMQEPGAAVPSQKETAIARAFLAYLSEVGKTLPAVHRSNGEVIT